MTRFLYTVLLTVLAFAAFPQEGLTPLTYNLNYFYPAADHKVSGDIKEVNNQKQKPGSLFLPIQDDFYYGYKSNYPDQNLWMDSSVYINTGFARAPPSIGVATFDGLNKHGYPYNTNATPNLISSEPADTLTTHPINLFITASNQTLTPADKIGLSFYYQPRGNGEPPEVTDSLILDLYKPRQQKWISRVWSAKGNSNPNVNDSAFKRHFLYLRDTAYLQDGFKFRFRNKATTSGNFDHWHLDYIYLNNNRDSLADTTYDDVTFAHVPTPFLRNYSAMPFYQYDTTEMAENNSVWLKNNNYKAANIYYAIKFYDKTNTQIGTYLAQSNNIPVFKYNGYFKAPVFANPAAYTSFQFPLMTDSADYKIEHFVYRNGPNTDILPKNDTVVQQHRFRDYYAFDDGSAEAGYYVQGAAGSMAVKIKLNKIDTLRALRIYFNPAPMGGSSYKFDIKVYQGGTIPGAAIAIQDSTHVVKYIKTGYKEIPEYKLEEPLVLSPGTYFIGIQQQVAAGIIVGFDRNYDSHGNLFYNSGSGWSQSGLAGALMLRPVFGAHGIAVGMNEQEMTDQAYSIYPNPSSGEFVIRGAEAKQKYRLFNSLGQLVLSGIITSSEQLITTNDLENGLYILMVETKSGSAFQEKIIISK